MMNDFVLLATAGAYKGGLEVLRKLLNSDRTAGYFIAEKGITLETVNTLLKEVRTVAASRDEQAFKAFEQKIEDLLNTIHAVTYHPAIGESTETAINLTVAAFKAAEYIDSYTMCF